MVEFIRKFLSNEGDQPRKSFQQLNAARMENFISEQQIQDYEIIDVRTPEEFNSGHLKMAKNINLFDPYFDEKVGGLDKHKTYFVICRSGNRSNNACQRMSKMGFENLYNISGGMMVWPGEVV
jgi:rhodanese-related sulfurtransferase